MFARYCVKYVPRGTGTWRQGLQVGCTNNKATQGWREAKKEQGRNDGASHRERWAACFCVHTSCAFHAGHHAVGLVVRIRRERGQAPHGAQNDADGKIRKELPVTTTLRLYSPARCSVL